jgi:hypothetical protein
MGAPRQSDDLAMAWLWPRALLVAIEGCTVFNPYLFPIDTAT